MPVYCCGLDLGRQTDYSALAALEVYSLPNPAEPLDMENHYRVVGLVRWPLRTPYTTTPHTGEVGIVESVGSIVGQPPLRECTLAIDQTGVGMAVVDFFRRAQLPCVLCPISITGGTEVVQTDDGGYHVPKKELVSHMEVLLQKRRLTIVPGLALADILRQEFANFNRKVTRAGNEQTGVWGAGKNDDCTLAVALAAWVGENTNLGWDGSLGLGMSQMAGMPPGVVMTDQRQSEEGIVLWEQPQSDMPGRWDEWKT